MADSVRRWSLKILNFPFCYLILLWDLMQHEAISSPLAAPLGLIFARAFSCFCWRRGSPKPLPYFSWNHRVHGDKPLGLQICVGLCCNAETRDLVLACVVVRLLWAMPHGFRSRTWLLSNRLTLPALELRVQNCILVRSFSFCSVQWIEDGMANDLGKGHIVNGRFAFVASDDPWWTWRCGMDLNGDVEKLLCPKSLAWKIRSNVKSQADECFH